MLFYNKSKHKFEFYPKAFERRRRVHGRHPSILPARLKFLRLAFINFFILQVLFLCLFSYIYGSLFQQNSRIHQLNVAFVDYDGGIIGTSIRTAYSNLQGPSFPTLIERSPSEYANEHELETAVCKTDYWAALLVSQNASSNFESALTGGPAANSYNRSNVLSYIWNEARYSTVVDSAIAANMLALTDVARAVLFPLYTTGVMRSNSSIAIDLTNLTVVSIFAQPWQLQSVNIQPTTQGSRAIYNTLVIVLMLIQDFFYLGTINGLSLQFKLFSRLFPRRIIARRFMISALYALIGSLCSAGAIWAFKVNWAVNSNQFVLSWMTLWLFSHLNFLTLDVFAAWLPPPYVPMALVTWVAMNVTSVLLPFELSSNFYRWAYMLPAHEVYQVLVDIWSGGCNPQLRYALPVLFLLELSSLGWSSLGVYRRCHYAVIDEEMKEKEFQERLDTAMELERKHEHRREEEAQVHRKAEIKVVSSSSLETMAADMEDAADSKMDPYSPSTTPGVDKMPYIRFAIDQLTRDQEVQSSRHYIGGYGDYDDDDDYPLDIILPEPSLRPVIRDKDMGQLGEMQAGPPRIHPLHRRQSYWGRLASGSITRRRSSPAPHLIFVDRESTEEVEPTVQGKDDAEEKRKGKDYSGICFPLIDGG